jgi:hypothetical protein
MKIMKRLSYLITVLFLLPGFRPASGQQNSDPNNSLTKDEIKQGWQLLWDGKTSTGWRSYNKQSFPERGWEMKDGILSVIPPKGQEQFGSDIITVRTFRNYELSVDFLYAPGANSGIKYFIDGKTNVGCEYQILDDKLHPDAKLGINGNRTNGGLYEMFPPKNKKDNGPDTWNTAKIIVNGNHVEHWLNGQMVVSYEKGDAAWQAAFATSKYVKIQGFASAIDSHILLQDHGNRVSFRNIKIREIK